MRHWIPAATLLLVTAPSVPASPLTEVYKRVQHSVVVIETEQKEIDPAFPGQLVMAGGLGSGVLISEDGKVLTAAHVVQAADRIVVHFDSGEQIPARVLASEPSADLSMIQLSRRPETAQVAVLGDSDGTEVGEQIFIVGAPMGISRTLTVGHISARREADQLIGGLLPTEQFQTDASINQGNSGGPMFDMNGEVIGIVSYIISQSGGSEGLGFVVTSNMARRLLLERRSMWSGIQGRALEGELARIFNLPQEYGVLVEIVADRSPAKHLGLGGGRIRARVGEEELIVGGDIILAVQGIEVSQASREEVRARMEALEPGEELHVRVLRGGEIVDLVMNFYPDLLFPTPPAE